MTDLAAYTLADQFGSEQGRATLSGVQAMVRMVLDQVRADGRVGQRTGALIAGYRGSPVGGIDAAYLRNQSELDANQVRFINGVNEELGATMVWGSQLASRHEAPLYDGVLGLWYGKGPGLDRAGDAIRHGNLCGTGRTDGVIAAVGDDPACKSSTLPSASEHSMADLALPTLYPASVQEILDYGRYGYELSRACGAWVGMKIHTDVADGSATVNFDPRRIELAGVPFLVDDDPWMQTVNDALLAPFSVQQENEAFTVRLDAARHFVATNRLDRTVGATDAWLGIIAGGKAYLDVRSALTQLGIESDADLVGAGIRIYKPAMIWPLEPAGLRRFASGTATIVAVEEKRAFLEDQVRNQLYGSTDAPEVIGKFDIEGRPLVPSAGALEPDQLVEPLRRLLQPRLGSDRLTPKRERIAVSAVGSTLPSRTPYFCSGCPHNRSTRVPEGSVAGGGIGCHGMALLMPGRATGITQMGGEGAQWVGLSPFVDEAHRFQNLGDGTLAHSGILAIRQAVSSGANITYKILYNGTVAMTGGQDAAGELAVPELTRELDAEGVARVVVVADDTEKYASDAWFAPGTKVVHRDKLDDIQLELREMQGTTVLIYDQGCAAELRRGRKRGRIERPTTRVFINEAVCDGCGHCGEISNCISVHPVTTPFGRKTRIHQESCNFDLTCLGGDCPAFITVTVDESDLSAGEHGAPLGATVAAWPMPADPVVPDEASLLIVGIGGTGVVTVNQLLNTAALLDDKTASSLDQTGLAQKGGQVVSHLRIGPDADVGSSRLAEGSADGYLVFDLVAGVSPVNLARTASDRTTAVVSTSRMPTGHMVTKRALADFPEVEAFRDEIDRTTRAESNQWVDAEGIATSVFRSQPAANLIVLGVAYQKGLVPVSGGAIERAIELNGVAVEMNTEAFRLGRRLAADPELAAEIEIDTPTTESPPALSAAHSELLASIDTDEALAETLAWRIPELVAYGGRSWVARYLETVGLVRRAEVAVPGRSDLADTVAQQLFRLMTYKDEYEVARLHRRPGLAEEIKGRFGAGASFTYQLKPPSLVKFGIDRKIGFGRVSSALAFVPLARMKRMRGSRLDPFGRSEERRIERDLIVEYENLAHELAGSLSVDNYERAVDIAGLADQVRGFSEVKLANVARYRGELSEARKGWGRPV